MTRSNPVTDIPPNFREGIRENGTVEGHFIETIYQPLERLELRNGYLALIMDAGGVDAETRIPLVTLRRFLDENPQ